MKNNESLEKRLLPDENEVVVEKWTKAIETIETQIENADKDEKKELKRILIKAKIGKNNAEIKRADSKDYKKIIHLRGKIIKLYKELEHKSLTKEDKFQARHKMIEEIKNHKQVINYLKNCKDTKISIPERLGLTIKDISDTISIFLKEKDVLKKIKNIGYSTAKSAIATAAISGGVALALALTLGVPMSVSAFSCVLPVCAYTGISSIIRNFTSKTAFENYEYQQTDEYKALVNVFNEKHKEELEEIAKNIKEKEKAKNNNDKIVINERIIEKLDALAKSTKTESLSKVFQLQAYSFYLENKDYCEKIKESYLENKDIDKEQYIENNKKLFRINMELWKRGNSLGDAIKSSGKQIAKSAKVYLLTKSILTAIAQYTSLPVNPNIISLTEALLFATVNGLINIPTYQNKLKFQKTEYDGKVELEDKNRIEEIIEKRKANVPRFSYS